MQGVLARKCIEIHCTVVVATVIKSCMNFDKSALNFYVNIVCLQKLQFNFCGAKYIFVVKAFSIVIKGCISE